MCVYRLYRDLYIRVCAIQQLHLYTQLALFGFLRLYIIGRAHIQPDQQPNVNQKKQERIREISRETPPVFYIIFGAYVFRHVLSVKYRSKDKTLEMLHIFFTPAGIPIFAGVRSVRLCCSVGLPQQPFRKLYYQLCYMYVCRYIVPHTLYSWYSSITSFVYVHSSVNRPDI